MSLEEQQRNLISRIRTIKGHLGGIEKMIEEKKSCEQILVQIAAVKSAMDKVGLAMIENYAEECIIAAVGDPDAVQKKVKDIVKTFSKFAK